MRSTRTVLLCGALILMLAMGVRQTMGLFLPPMTLANGWTRDEFAFAIALQNLLWGAFVPFTGAIADRFGAGRVLVLSALDLHRRAGVDGVLVHAARFPALGRPAHRPRAFRHDVRRGDGRGRESGVA
jgi:MFS family permease